MRDGRRDTPIDGLAGYEIWYLVSGVVVLAGGMVRAGWENEKLLVDGLALLHDESWT